MRNNSGPKDEPCGTPHTRSLKFESEPFIETNGFLFERYDLIKLFTLPCRPSKSILYTKYHGLPYKVNEKSTDIFT